MSQEISNFLVKPNEIGNNNIPIYRIIPFQYLLDMVVSSTMKISQTKFWDDTYENFLAKTEFTNGEDTNTYEAAIDFFYGQCWSLKEESDALWRIYSNDKTGVRIKTTVDTLLHHVDFGIGYSLKHNPNIWIGTVNYRSIESINDWVDRVSVVNAINLKDSLLMKRTEFEHEKEVRLIIHSIQDVDNSPSLLNFTSNSNQLIEEVTFDPRLDDKSFELNKKILRKLGFENKVNKSSLYDFKPHRRPY